MKVLYKIMGLVFLVISIHPAMAKIVMPSVFSNNMVLQQKTNAAIWGKATAGKTVTLTCSWATKKYSALATVGGDFKFTIPTPGFGGPYTIELSDGEAIRFDNVLIGEVWICSGQSNMEMPLGGWGKIKDYEKEIAAANYPAIRLLQVNHETANQPIDNAKVSNGGWTECTPQYIAEFSSVAYFFARDIYNKTKIPVGLIHSSWGGTIAETWVSGTTLKTMADFKAATESIENTSAEGGQKKYEQQMADWMKMIPLKDAGYTNGQPEWQKAVANGSWKTIAIPDYIETIALPDFDGVVWLRKKITVPETLAGQDMQLSLGEIDDNETTWVNGEKIGETQGYNQSRNYSVKGPLVKAGENEIVVRVFDGGGGGGLYGDAKNMNLTAANGQKIPLAGNWLYKVGMSLKDMPPKPAEVTGANRPTVLYNAIIHPFIQYAIRGAIWYQGEANADRAYQYQTLFPALITDWRKDWKQGNFPFYFVQLANYMKRDSLPGASAWAELREAQLKALALPNTGMAVTIDIGEANDIHPKNKQEVGHRLALIALAKTYGEKEVYSGPLYSKLKVVGREAVVDFKYSEGGLRQSENKPLSGFELAGADQKFYPADATIKGTQVIVSSSKVELPVAVRYNWSNNPSGNLTNASGLPASPFRSDIWKGITYGKK